MSTDARRALTMRANLLEIAANYKLGDPRNVEKGDDWDELEGWKIYDRIHEEVEELFEVINVYLEDESGMGEEEFHFALRNEAGDVINFLRFICSKYGAI